MLHLIPEDQNGIFMVTMDMRHNTLSIYFSPREVRVARIIGTKIIDFERAEGIPLLRMIYTPTTIIDVAVIIDDEFIEFVTVRTMNRREVAYLVEWAEQTP